MVNYPLEKTCNKIKYGFKDNERAKKLIIKHLCQGGGYTACKYYINQIRQDKLNSGDLYP